MSSSVQEARSNEQQPATVQPRWTFVDKKLVLMTGQDVNIKAVLLSWAVTLAKLSQFLQHSILWKRYLINAMFRCHGEKWHNIQGITLQKFTKRAITLFYGGKWCITIMFWEKVRTKRYGNISEGVFRRYYHISIINTFVIFNRLIHIGILRQS